MKYGTQVTVSCTHKYGTYPFTVIETKFQSEGCKFAGVATSKQVPTIF